MSDKAAKIRELRKDPAKFQAAFEAADKMGRLIGARPISLSASESIFEYDVKPEHFNPNGILHGGALYTVMDSAQGAFLHFILDEKFKFAATGTATIRYDAAVSKGMVSIRTVLDRHEGRKYFLKSVATQDSKTVATLDEVWIAIA